MVIMTVKTARNGRAIKQQTRSILRFHAGKWFTSLSDALTEIWFFGVSMEISVSKNSISWAFLELLAGRLVPLICSYDTCATLWFSERKPRETPNCPPEWPD